MENRLLSFDEFETLYESFGFIAEAEVPDFTPLKTTVSADDLASLFGGKMVDEAFDAKTFTVIKKGETSERVKQLQKDLGLPDFGKYNGVFGDTTDKAVRAFQTKNKLTVDGKVGVQTLRKMLALKGDKTPDKTIEAKYIKVTTPGQAKAAGIDPELLKLYQVTIVNNGETQYVILIPYKGSDAKAKALQSKGAFKGFEWLLEGVKYIGKALIYTAIGVTLVSLEIARSIISGLANAVKSVANGVVYVMGAVLQGLVTVGKWIGQKGKAAYAKISTAASELWGKICKGFAKVAKSSVQAITAFMMGVKVVSLTVLGLAVVAVKAVATLLAPAVKAIVQAAKDGSALIVAGAAWIGKNVKNGAIAFKNAVVSGWEYTIAAGKKAYDGIKSAAQSTGQAFVDGAKYAYQETAKGLNNLYDEGEKAWNAVASYFESLESTGNSIFESDELAFTRLDFTIV